MQSATTPPSAPPWRIAVVSLLRHLDAHHCLTGLYHRADQLTEIWVRKFNAEEPDFQREVLHPLKQWHPHGLIVRLNDAARLRRLRRQFPGLPIVSTFLVAPDLVNTVVAGDLHNAITVARDYFHKCGLSHVALFGISGTYSLARIRDAFRQVVPQGLELICPWKVLKAHTPAGKKRRRQIMTDGLRRLPTPVGVIAFQTSTGPILSEWCGKVGLRVPQDVQIIGLDEEDLCLESATRLSSYVPPNDRIGEMALETMLRYLRQEQPPPPPIIRVPGGTIIPRDSMAMLRIGEPAVTGALDLMQAKATQGLTAARAAKLSGVGQTTFYKQFTATTGRTPARHLRQLRLEAARRLLRETNETATAIATACGFKNLSDFAHFFRRQTGQTPTTYRQKIAHR